MPPTHKPSVESPTEPVAIKTKSYFAKCIAIVRPIRGRVFVSALVAIAVVTVKLKSAFVGSSLLYSAISAILIVLGIGLVLLSTAAMVGDGSHR